MRNYVSETRVQYSNVPYYALGCQINYSLYSVISGMAVSLAINGVMSVVGGVMVARTIPVVSQMFMKAGLSGRDLCKPDKNAKV